VLCQNGFQPYWCRRPIGKIGETVWSTTPSAFIAVHMSVSRAEECPRQLSLSVVLQGGRSSWKTLSKTITGA